MWKFPALRWNHRRYKQALIRSNSISWSHLVCNSFAHHVHQLFSLSTHKTSQWWSHTYIHCDLVWPFCAFLRILTGQRERDLESNSAVTTLHLLLWQNDENFLKWHVQTTGQVTQLIKKQSLNVFVERND